MDIHLRQITSADATTNIINADAHMTVTIGFIIRICMAERFKYGYVASNGGATIVKINGHVRWILQKVN